jgi:hypothetical protein
MGKAQRKRDRQKRETEKERGMKYAESETDNFLDQVYS